MFWRILDSSVNNLFVQMNGNVVITNSSFFYYIFVFLGLIFAISFHEFAHAWAAYTLGDDTAKREGRMTLNPLAHFDLLGFALILFTYFGYGKPVPVNPNRFKNPAQGSMFVSLAGPASNFILASISGVLFLILKRLVPAEPNLITTFIHSLPLIGFINFSLMAFNLLPIPPLDGSKIWGYFHYKISDFINYKIAPYSMFIIFALIIPIFGDFSILSLMMMPVGLVYFGLLKVF